jgi:hypothetical protein
MTITKLTAILSLTAALAAAAPALAFASGSSGDGDLRNGMHELGVDISNVPDDPASVHEFLAQLPADAYPAVIGGCQTALDSPTGTSLTVYDFCTTAVGPNGRVASYPEARRTVY